MMAAAGREQPGGAAGLPAPCVFFDRDGIINKSPGPGYVMRNADFHLLPGFVAALRVTRSQGLKAVVVTNQRGVARGLMSREAVDGIHRHLEALLAQAGLGLDGIYVCPHDAGECDCRKPQAGLLLRAAREHGIDLSRSWMVGDHETDVQAGRAAGCRTVRVGGDEPDSEADFRLSDMYELADFLQDRLPFCQGGE